MKEVKQLKLVKEIMSLLNLTEDGKLGSFFKGQVKILANEIKSIQQNMKTLVLQNEQRLSNLQDEIEDAEQNVADQYLNIELSQIKTNADQKAFGEHYWGEITKAEKKLQELRSRKKMLIDQAETAAETNQAQITEREYRIQKISEVTSA